MSNPEIVARLKVLREEIDTALGAVMANNPGLTLQLERATYTSGGAFTFKLTGTLPGGKSHEQGDYDVLRKGGHPDLPEFGTVVKIRDEQVRIVGARLRARFNVVGEILTGFRKGKKLCWRADDIVAVTKKGGK